MIITAVFCAMIVWVMINMQNRLTVSEMQRRVLANDAERQGQYVRLMVDAMHDVIPLDAGERRRDLVAKLRADLNNEASRQARVSATKPFTFYVNQRKPLE